MHQREQPRRHHVGHKAAAPLQRAEDAVAENQFLQNGPRHRRHQDEQPGVGARGGQLLDGGLVAGHHAHGALQPVGYQPFRPGHGLVNHRQQQQRYHQPSLGIGPQSRPGLGQGPPQQPYRRQAQRHVVQVEQQIQIAVHRQETVKPVAPFRRQPQPIHHRIGQQHVADEQHRPDPPAFFIVFLPKGAHQKHRENQFLSIFFPIIPRKAANANRPVHSSPWQNGTAPYGFFTCYRLTWKVYSELVRTRRKPVGPPWINEVHHCPLLGPIGLITPSYLNSTSISTTQLFSAISSSCK